ncbi:uncharacterized protein LOC112526624 isoform X2 [Cynara cardunculus var. scolymus]|nr:uncharacterized protein LOC112526624 isoform X2 [Cynara cardunculus var. scolymus]
MPSGAKKRKAAKKKKVHHSSTTTQSHQAMAGENDGGELSSPASQDPCIEGEVIEVKKEGNSSETTFNSIEKNSNVEEGGNIEIEIGVKSKNSNGSSSSSSSSGSSDDEVEKKVVVLESVPVIESMPEKITQKVEDLEISPIVEPVIKPVDSSLEEVSQDCDEPKNEEKKDLVVEEQTVVVSESELKDDCLVSSVVVESVSKENGVVKSPLLDEKASSESKDCVASSTSVTDSISEVNGANHANDTDTIGHSDRQPPVAASTPLAVQKTTSWKSCCGIFELFSGSER